jgi:hypothetical protein
MFMPNFSSSAFTQTDLEFFCTFFQENFQEELLSEFQKNPNVCCLMLQLAKNVHAKFQLPSFYPDGLRQIFEHFSSEFQSFLKKISK